MSTGPWKANQKFYNFICIETFINFFIANRIKYFKLRITRLFSFFSNVKRPFGSFGSSAFGIAAPSTSLFLGVSWHVLVIPRLSWLGLHVVQFWTMTHLDFCDPATGRLERWTYIFFFSGAIPPNSACRQHCTKTEQLLKIIRQIF